MSESRRNLSIMGLVVALTIAAGAAVAVKGFTLGLDLRGGLEVVLKARPTDNQTITSDTLNQAADVMRRRIDPRGILQPEIRTSPSDNQIDISIPGVKNPNAVANLLVAGQLQSFDFYKFLTPVSTRSLYVAAPNPSLYDMLRSAKKQIPTGTPAGWALFSAKAPHGLAKVNGIVSRIEPLQRQVLEDSISRPSRPGRCGCRFRRARPRWLSPPSAPTRRRPGRSGTCSRSRPRTRRS